jgi:diguanylate cyclase (GGDEF)-like protein
MTEEGNHSAAAPQERARPARRRLAARLLAVLTAGLLAILAGELSVRRWIELPELYRIEHASDTRAVNRLRGALARRIGTLSNTCRDYAAWDATYRFMELAAGSPDATYYVESEIGPTTYRNNQINGILIFDNDAQLVHGANIDLETGSPSPGLDLRPESLDPRAFRRRSTQDEPVVSGIASSNVGYILFASAPIVDTAELYPARGIMLIWRLIDRSELNAIAALVNQKFTLIPVAQAEADPDLSPVIERLQGGADFTPRDANETLYWQLDDFTGKPAFLVRQTAGPRSFDAGLFSPSSTAGFIISGFVLVLIALYFSRRFVERVAQASVVMRKIRETGAFHHRIPTTGAEMDELDEMFQHFNALLARVARQEEELREQNRRLAELSQQDTLTGIPNRRALNENFDRFWRQAVRAKRPISVLMIDVDYFKPYNDRYGHLAGDRVLKQVAESLQENLHRATDFVARYGGEEFCVVLTETPLDHAVRVAEGLRKAVMDLGIRHENAPQAGVVTISIGIASAMANQAVVHIDLLREADRALYRAKEFGRNRVFHFEEDPTETVDRPEQKDGQA